MPPSALGGAGDLGTCISGVSGLRPQTCQPLERSAPRNPRGIPKARSVRCTGGGQPSEGADPGESAPGNHRSPVQPIPSAVAPPAEPRVRFGCPLSVVPEPLGGRSAPLPPASARPRFQRPWSRTLRICSNSRFATGGGCAGEDPARRFCGRGLNRNAQPQREIEKCPVTGEHGHAVDGVGRG